MRSLLAAAVLLAALPSLADEAPPVVDVYAFCDASPRIDAPPPRPLTVAVTRRSEAVALVSATVKGPGARAPATPVKVDASGLPAELRAWYPPALCAGALEVEVTVKDVGTGARRVVKLTAAVQTVQ